MFCVRKKLCNERTKFFVIIVIILMFMPDTTSDSSRSESCGAEEYVKYSSDWDEFWAGECMQKDDGLPFVFGWYPNSKNCGYCGHDFIEG